MPDKRDGRATAEHVVGPESQTLGEVVRGGLED